MKKKIQNIKKRLEKIVNLLRFCDLNDWANKIEILLYEIDDDPFYTAKNILFLYGGMGSLNDLILHKNGKILVEENNDLEKSKNKLYALCQELVHSEN